MILHIDIFIQNINKKTNQEIGFVNFEMINKKGHFMRGIFEESIRRMVVN